MKFERDQDREDFIQLHPKLRKIVDYMELYYVTLFGFEPTVTYIVRHDTSTHNQKPPFRFIDIRCRDIERKEAERLRLLVNAMFPYGLTGKGVPGETIVKLDHSDTSINFDTIHFHVQVGWRQA